MKKLTIIAMTLIILTMFTSGYVYAESNTGTVESIIGNIEELMDKATPEEQQEIIQYLIQYMFYLNGASANKPEVPDGNKNIIESDNVESKSEFETYSIEFRQYDVKMEITSWEVVDFITGFGYKFNITFYNNSNEDFEIGIKDLKVNGWNLMSNNTYNSLARLAAGEKVRDTWVISDIEGKTDVTSEEDVNDIDGIFFIGDYDSWGKEIESKREILDRDILDSISH